MILSLETVFQDKPHFNFGIVQGYGSPKQPVCLDEAKVEYSLIQYRQQKRNRIVLCVPLFSSTFAVGNTRSVESLGYARAILIGALRWDP
jgi:hypothetical protein